MTKMTVQHLSEASPRPSPNYRPTTAATGMAGCRTEGPVIL